MANYFGVRIRPSQGKTDLVLHREHAKQALADEQRSQTGRPLLDKEEKETWPDGRVTWASTEDAAVRRGGQIIRNVQHLAASAQRLAGGPAPAKPNRTSTIPRATPSCWQNRRIVSGNRRHRLVRLPERGGIRRCGPPIIAGIPAGRRTVIGQVSMMSGLGRARTRSGWVHQRDGREFFATVGLARMEWKAARVAGCRANVTAEARGGSPAAAKEISRRRTAPRAPSWPT